MANKKTAKIRGELPPPQTLAFPESEFSRFWKSKMVELEAAKREHEQRWGVGRLINLVDVEFRIKVWTQIERVWAAQESQNIERARAAADGMIRAMRALEQWATAEGIAPVGEVKAIEWMMDDGTVLAVVSTEADAVEYQRVRPDVENRHIWSIQEIAKMLEAGLGNDIARMKVALGMPATVVKVEANGSGFDDFGNDLDLDAPSSAPKMFPTAMKPFEKME
jgi:hypothetical protein